MKFEIVWPDSVLKQMNKLDRSIVKRIYEAVDKLENDPSRWVSRLVNSPYYKMTVGDYRVILDIQGKQLRVLVVKVGHRKNIYKK
ncbi:MAG: type II toxin-antitoxin system RelE/ParE family toxin [Candidatus Thermoplasmatota archaeon]|nr:type II toxin-antitoxin system RelE/ParE family toxin [Euryarchaeota archaeon]MBU4591522.1 type II toxin-antitoxin system RelE/ParE family toxin [Candidatus Thermoplasmatota archaeon]